MTVSDINCKFCFVWVWIWFQIRHEKQNSGFSMPNKNEIRLHIPLLSLTGDVRRRAKKNSSTCHANFLWKLMHMQVQKKLLLLVVSCSVQTARIQGFFLPARTAAKNGLGKFSVVRTCLGPIHIIHPSMLVALAPTKSLCEQIAKTG